MKRVLVGFVFLVSTCTFANPPSDERVGTLFIRAARAALQLHSTNNTEERARLQAEIATLEQQMAPSLDFIVDRITTRFYADSLLTLRMFARKVSSVPTMTEALERRIENFRIGLRALGERIEPNGTFSEAVRQLDLQVETKIQATENYRSVAESIRNDPDQSRPAERQFWARFFSVVSTQAQVLRARVQNAGLTPHIAAEIYYLSLPQERLQQRFPTDEELAAEGDIARLVATLRPLLQR